MKIVHTINSLSMGGAEALVLLELIELRERGHEVAVIALEPGNPEMTSRFLESEINVINIKGRRYFSLLEYLRVIKKLKPDVLHTHLFPALLYGNAAKFFAPKTHFVHTEHNTSNNRRKFHLWPFDVSMYLMLSKLICISHGVLESTKRWNPLLRTHQPTVIENSFPPSKTKTEYCHSPNHIRLLSVGRLVEDKNYDLQLSLLARLPHLYLDIYGDGHLRQELQKKSEIYGVGRRVRFMGIQKDLSGVYKDYDGYLHTANLEGFGLVVAEAMSAGLPVFVANIPGVSEVVGDGGFLYQSNSIDDLETKVVTAFAEGPSHLKMIGLKAIEKSRRFSIKSHVDKLEKAYYTLPRHPAI